MPDVDCGLCHASAIHISPTSLFVSRKSWNPTSTRPIATTKNVSGFVPFRKRVFTTFHANARFSLFLVILCILHLLFRRNASFMDRGFSSVPAMSRSNDRRTIEAHAGLTTVPILMPIPNNVFDYIIEL